MVCKAPSKAYIAGKITGDPEYREKFQQAKKAIEKHNISVIVPSVLPGGLSKSDYMRICFAMIDCADVVYFLPDWEESEGAKVEKAYCEYVGKPIRFFRLEACNE